MSRARVLEPSDALLPQRRDFGRETFQPIFFRHADAPSLHRGADRRLIVRHRRVDAGGVLGVDAGHRAQHDRRVAHGAGDRPGLIQRGGEGDDAPARAASVSRLYADRAGEGRRLADRAAGVGRRRAKAQTRRDRRRRAAGRTAGHDLRGVEPAVALAPPGRHDGAKGAGLVRRAHREFVEVEFAEHDRAVAQKIGADGRFISGREIVEDAARRRRAHALGAVEILDPERQTFERSRLAARNTRVALLGGVERQLRRLGDEGVEQAGALDGLDMRLREFAGGQRLRQQGVARLSQSEMRGIGHEGNSILKRRAAGGGVYSMTLGTTKK